MQLVSEIHVYTGFKFMHHTKLQVGHLCPDEILDLELDKIDRGGVPPSTDSFAMPFSVSQYEKAEVERIDALKAKNSPINNDKNQILYKDGNTNFKQAIEDSPRFASAENSPERPLQMNSNPATVVNTMSPERPPIAPISVKAF